MQKEYLKQIASFKIEQLFKPGTKAIKKALNKLGQQQDMPGLCSTHPTTLTSGTWGLGVASPLWWSAT
eukprot:307502-Rhodomonas_salina.1